jgi:ABC-2 type transport system permease protein
MEKNSKKRIYLSPNAPNMNTIGLYTFIARETQRLTRVYVQVLLSPVINAVLYILIFGFVVGSQIGDFNGVRYIEFVMPGVLMLNLIGSAFSHSSSSLYMGRWTKAIEEMLVAPLSYLEMIIGFVVSGIIRGLIIGGGIYMVAILFDAATIAHIGWFLFYTVAVTIIFSLLGLLVGLWANNFEQLTVLNTFLITPLTFLGGVFNSISMMPEKVQWFVRLNPFFYFVDGLRYSMIGIHEANTMVGLGVIGVLILGLGALIWHLFSIGWRIRV